MKLTKGGAQSLCLTLDAMTPGPFFILFVGLPAVASPLGVIVVIGEVHLLHVV